MSLEKTLETTNELLSQIITILQTGISAPAALGEPEVKATRTRKTKDAAAAESVYWLIEKHNTVYEQKAGDTAPSIEGAVQVSKEVFDAKKAQFAALTNTAANAQANAASSQPTAEAVADDAQKQSTQQQEPPASTATTATATSAGDVPFTAVIEAMTALNKSTEPGHGREGVLSILKQFLPGDDKPTVTKLQPLGKNAEVVATVQALLAPKAEAEFDPLA